MVGMACWLVPMLSPMLSCGAWTKWSQVYAQFTFSPILWCRAYAVVSLEDEEQLLFEMGQAKPRAACSSHARRHAAGSSVGLDRVDGGSEPVHA